MDTADSPVVLRPRLLVDWGELPQVGRVARPLFNLIGSAAAGRPTVQVTVDRGLDNDHPANSFRQIRTEEPGLWTFDVPFSVTSNGLPALPGLYVIDVAVTFPHATTDQPRFLQTRIRLNIPDGNSGQRELVIDGDGQSVVNLAGHDLRSFSRVVLKGDDSAIINLQNFAQAQEQPAPPAAPVVFEYELKINRDIHERLPEVVEVGQPNKTDSITLVCGDRRIHVIAKKRATLGRQRRPENDICLRFLPRSTEHDEGSRAISRTHIALDLSDDGLVLVDEKSAKGVDVDCDPVKEEKTFTYLDAHGGRHIDLPSPLSSSLSLEMELTISGRDPDDPDFHSDLKWDDVCFETAGEPASRLWQVAKASGIEAARLRRLNNVPVEEYVFLYRHATIGRSAKDHAIALPIGAHLKGDLRLLYAGRMFWLHSGGRASIAVDGRPISGPCLIPLSFGQCLVIDSLPVHVTRVAQCQLDEDPVLATPPAPQPISPAPQHTAASMPPPLPPAVAIKAGPAGPPPVPPVMPLRSAGQPPSDVAPGLPASADNGAAAESVAVAPPSSSLDPVRDALASVALIACRVGHGSAFMARPGLLVTNYHVIADDAVEDLTALFIDPVTHARTHYPVSLVGEDPEHDLAFLSVEALAPPLGISPRFHHQNGHRIAVIGSPGVGGNGERLENVVTDGRLGPVYSDSLSPSRWSLSITLNPGNSGGPVLDAQTGEVLGVTVAKFTTVEGLALAVPHDVLQASLERAAATSGDALATAQSLHRQRYCLRKISGFVAGANVALHDFAEHCDELEDGLTTVSGNSLIGRVGSDFADTVVTALTGLAEEVASHVNRLQNDPACRKVVRDDFAQAWASLDDLRYALSGVAAGRSRAVVLDRLGTTLATVEELCESIRSEIDGSLLSGKTVFDAAASSSAGHSLALQQVAFGGPAGFAKPKRRYLTKSRFTMACTCPTKLFYTAKPGEYASVWTTDPLMESLANEGNRVGALARLYFPEGEMVDTLDHDESVRQTDALLERTTVTIFEAAIRHGDLFIRTDILCKSPTGIDLYEVKSKGYSEDDDGDFTTKFGVAADWLRYIRDVAFQKYIVSQAFPGVSVRAHLYLPDKFRAAVSDDLGMKAAALLNGEKASLTAEELASPLLRAINVDSVCDIVLNDSYTLGDKTVSFPEYVTALAEYYCQDKKFPPQLSPTCFTCEFDTSPFALATGEKSGKRECWADLLGWTDQEFATPQIFEIGNLPAAKKRSLLEERRLHMHQLEEADIAPQADGEPGLSQSQRQWLQVTKAVGGDASPHLDRDNLRSVMAGWKFPLHFIDFETCRAVIPFHRGSRSRSLVAFQFSHHVMHADGAVEHAGEFLCAQHGVDPGVAFVEALQRELGGDDGTVLHYAPHEVSTLRALAAQVRTRRSEIPNADELLAFIATLAPYGDQAADRQVVDLCNLVKRFYYSPSMRGSNSIKDVLPAVLNGSDCLKQKYSQPVYGSTGGIPSHNFTDMRWVEEYDGDVRDPYSLLPPIDGVQNPAEKKGDAQVPRLLRNGGAAMQAYADLQLASWTPQQRQSVEQALLRYCELDTLAMVFIVEAWREWCR
jgi:S1-C subfamily serine protease